MSQHCPSADEVARIIIAACRTVGADPLKIAAELPHGRPPEYLQRISYARGYAAMVLRKLFPSLNGAVISRLVGARNTAYAVGLFGEVARGKLRWYDETDFRAILFRCRVDQHAPAQVVIDETVRSYPMPAEPPKPAPPSARFGSKLRLEEELRRAVENTARMQRANEGQVQ